MPSMPDSPMPWLPAPFLVPRAGALPNLGGGPTGGSPNLSAPGGPKPPQRFDAAGYVKAAKAAGVPDETIWATLMRNDVAPMIADSLLKAATAPSAGFTNDPPAPKTFDVVGYVRAARDAGIPEATIRATLERNGITENDQRYGAINALLNGITLGLAPRALAAIDAATGQGNYDERLKARLAAKALYEAEHPTAAAVSNVVGGALPFLTGGGVLPAAERLAGKVAAGAVTGAAAGALQGAGSAAPGEVLPEAAKGAGVGAVLGGAFSGLSTATARLWQTVFGPHEPVAAALATLQRSPAFKNEITALESRLRNQLARLDPNDPGTVMQATAARNEMLDLLKKLAAKSPQARETLEKVAAEHGERASELYRQAYESSVAVTPEIRSALADPRVQAAYAAVAKKLPNLPVINDLGENAAVPTQALDMVKRELDKQVSRAVRIGDGATIEQVGDLRDAIRSEIAKQNPIYADALKWSSVQQTLKGAVTAGNKAANTELVKNPTVRPLATTGAVASPFLAWHLFHNPAYGAGLATLEGAVIGGKALAKKAAQKQLGVVADVLTSPLSQYGPALLQPISIARRWPAAVGGIGAGAAANFLTWLKAQQEGGL